jgi:hypothetical protein
MPTMQVVMPLEGFLSAVLFTNRVVKRLVRDNIITQEQADAVLAPQEDPPSVA